MGKKIITSLVENSPLRGLWNEDAQNCNCDIQSPTGCPFITGEDCLGNLQSCSSNYEQCSIYHAKNLKYRVN
jgi:hypothetical protein